MNFWKIGFFVTLSILIFVVLAGVYYWTTLDDKTIANNVSDNSNSELHKWVEDYNNGQWQKYSENWSGVKNSSDIKKALDCKSSIDKRISELEPIYLVSLRNQETGDRTVKDRYYVELYKTFKSMSDRLGDIGYWYSLDEPRFEGGLFIYTSFDNNSQIFNQAYVDDRLDDTEHTLNYYADQFEKDLDFARKLHCPDLDSLDVDISLNSNQCKEIVMFFNSTAYEPTRDGFDLEEEYKIELDKFKLGQEEKLNSCNSITQWGYLYFR